ncbi:uncharacterized protein LOC115357917 [Myripristis murdjan]|uniref:uncharacterized protein LOC115357917 n=1 Tax=Myripristis murdjan TaxID=586833 RepID=UPI0011762E31|nr:uncharacterized protein LOC115357917 [Myripristis murdjan]
MNVVQEQDGEAATYTPTEICALKGSTVEMQCTYTYPYSEEEGVSRVGQALWFTKVKGEEPVGLRSDSEYEGRVEYQGVQIEVTPNSSSSQAELKCLSSCSLSARPSYVWYKNGQKFKEGASPSYADNFNPDDSYSCTLQGHEDFHSPSVCVRGQTCNRVTYTDRSICAVKGSSVNISCSYNSYENDVRSKFWFSFKRSDRWRDPSQPEDLSGDSEFAGRVQLFEERGRCTLRITELRESDSTEYRFKFKTSNVEWGSSLPGTTLTVTDPAFRVQVTVSQQYPHSTWAELKCHIVCHLPGHPSSFIWYKNGVKLRERISFRDRFVSADSYSCAVKEYEDFHSPPLCVHGQTCNRVTYTDRSICAVKGSSVDISCSYNSFENDVGSKFWFSLKRSDRWQNSSQPEDLSGDSEFAGRVQLIEERGRSTLRITELRESDSAEYRFKFKTHNFEWRSSLPGTTLTVTDLQVEVIRSSIYQSYTEAELKCRSICSQAARPFYVWKKKSLNSEQSDPVQTVQSDSDPVYESVAAAQTEATEEQEDQV